MSEIKRVTDPDEGPLDGVSLDTDCGVTTFTDDKNPKQRKIEKLELVPCRILASYGEGLLSVSVREMGFMVSIRLDELFAVVKTAADASIELKEKQGGIKN